MHVRSLQCEVVKIEYDPKRREGRLWMADGDCCDMSACVELFETIDPVCTRIVTFSGDKQDTVYFCQPRGDWTVEQ